MASLIVSKLYALAGAGQVGLHQPRRKRLTGMQARPLLGDRVPDGFLPPDTTKKGIKTRR